MISEITAWLQYNRTHSSGKTAPLFVPSHSPHSSLCRYSTRSRSSPCIHTFSFISVLIMPHLIMTFSDPFIFLSHPISPGIPHSLQRQTEAIPGMPPSYTLSRTSSAEISGKIACPVCFLQKPYNWFLMSSSCFLILHVRGNIPSVAVLGHGLHRDHKILQGFFCCESRYPEDNTSPPNRRATHDGWNLPDNDPAESYNTRCLQIYRRCAGFFFCHFLHLSILLPAGIFQIQYPCNACEESRCCYSQKSLPCTSIHPILRTGANNSPDAQFREEHIAVRVQVAPG